MKKKFIFVLCIAIVIGLMLFLLRKAEQTPQPVLVTKINESDSSATNNAAQQSPANKLTVAQKAEGYNLTTEAEKNAEARQMLEARNKPVDFWGKVVDQDDNPLSAVKVEAEIGHFVWPPEQAPNGVSTKQELLTDTDGKFHVHDDSATGVYVILNKECYEQESPKGNGYALGYGGGTEDNPVALRMWNTNVLQKLIAGEKHFHIIPDGRSYFVDLSSGVISETGDGDLKVWVQYPGQVTQDQLYDWSCEIDVLNGGLLEETNGNSPMFIAPIEGYAPSFRLEQKIKSGKSGSIGDRKFYLMLKNGREYGRVQIDLIAPYNANIPGLIRFSYAINPSGSRILR